MKAVLYCNNEVAEEQRFSCLVCSAWPKLCCLILVELIHL
jgi:hypothetical protein